MRPPGQSDDDRVLEAGRRLCAAVRRFHERGWCSATSGNFSTVLDGSPPRLLITRSGCDKSELTPADLAIVDHEGNPEPGATGRPSAETLVHCAIVRATEARSVLHTHSVAATLLGERWLARGGFAITGYEMLKGLEGIGTHEAWVFVPILPNTQDMAALGVTVTGLIAARPGLRGFLVAGHGLYTWGRSIEAARRHIEAYEFLLECVARRTTFEPFRG
jgi:methylthioribulose-1-phosphate dehydratase